MISNGHLIQIGAEQQHEKNAVSAVASVLDDATEALISPTPRCWPRDTGEDAVRGARVAAS